MVRRRREDLLPITGKARRSPLPGRGALKAAIVCPTPPEYFACRAALRLEKEGRLGGRLVSRRGEAGLSLLAVKAWPGKAACASAAQLIIDVEAPHVVLDIGAAGALDPSLEPGTVLCVERAYEYDIVPLEEFPRRSFELTASTILAGAPSRKKKIMLDFMKKAEARIPGPPLVFGGIACGEKDVADSSFRNLLRSAFGAAACDWETAAVLRTAARNGVPALSFRVITDRADENLEADYRRNLSSALDRLGRVLALFMNDGYVFSLFY